MKTMLYSSPLGEIILAADKGALTGLWFRGQRYERAGLDETEAEDEHEEVLSRAAAWLDGYFDGKASAPDFPLRPKGTEFQKRVWEELGKIPYGETLSYGELARRLGCMSARAVGSAVGRNPISLAIPCHRVLGSGGSLTGYAGGLERKKRLLELERAFCC